tara:strand:- start:8846 stop:9928 length:1083 start_codon:yes stop_codon:yes gene_type:complete
MQIPAGLLSDQFGPRRILTTAMLTCALSTLLFSLSNSLSLAGASRLMLGFGASFAYCCPLLIAKHWFPEKRFALIGGCIQTLGALGAMIGNEPIAVMTEYLGWRDTMEIIALFGILFAAIMWVIVQDKPHHKQEQHITPHQIKTLTALKRVFQLKQNWVAAILGFCCWAPMTIVAELWGRTFITTHFHFNLQQSALMVSWIWIGVAVGGPLMGWLSNYIHSRKKALLLGYVLCLLSTLVLVYQPGISQIVIMASLFIFGLACATQCVTFGVISDINEKGIIGTAIGFNNMAVISGGIFLQPIVSVLLHHASLSHFENKVFIPSDFQYAFYVIPIVSCIGIFITTFCLKESLQSLPEDETV